MPTTKSAIDATELAALVEDAKANRPISPLRFTDQLMYDLRDLEGKANVADQTSELNPADAQLQAYMQRSLEVMGVLLELGFTPDNALFWFRCFRVLNLKDKTPVAALAEDCTEQVIEDLRRVFGIDREELGAFYERMREDTLSIQVDVFRDMQMLSAVEAAHACGIDSTGMNPLDVARTIEKTKRAIYILKGREPCFPACQFDTSGPKEIIAGLIKTLSPYRSSWDIVVWLWGSNGWLNGVSPMDMLDSESDRVLDAAFQHVVEEIEADESRSS